MQKVKCNGQCSQRHNVRCILMCSVQFARELEQFTRSAEVECTLRRAAATLETFSDQVNQASDPSNLYLGQFWRLPLFLPPTQSRIQPFSEANLVLATFCPAGLSKFIFASTARAQSHQGSNFNFGALNFLQGACCTSLCLNRYHSAFQLLQRAVAVKFCEV